MNTQYNAQITVIRNLTRQYGIAVQNSTLAHFTDALNKGYSPSEAMNKALAYFAKNTGIIGKSFGCN